MLKHKKIIIGGIAVLVVIIIGISLFFVSSGGLTGRQQVSIGEPVDIVHDLYGPWLKAAQSTTTNPYQEGLGKSPFLSKELRERLEVPQGGLDPVLCQTVIPAKISMRTVYEGADKTEILVTAKKPATSTEQAIFTLLPLDGGWYINSIRCSPGEFAPDSEFSFDRDGQLVKKVSPPLDPQYWHLVFEEDGQTGHYAPLFFSTGSMCHALDGSTAVCNPDTFIEASKAHVQGQMTEKGVEVKRIELMK